jgi:hypothetical protein
MAEQRKSPYPWILIAAGALLVLAGLVWVVGNQAPTPAATLTPASVEQVTRVSLEDAKAAFDGKKAVFLDVRDLSSYAVNHIPGAVLIPINELASRTGELDPKTWIITYCT